jgi:putative ABC transport system permease protein
MGTIARDVIGSFRTLWRQRRFSVAVVLFLGTGMAASLAVYTLVRSELLRPLPYASPERLVSVTQTSTRYPAGVVLAPEYAAWRQESHALSALAAWNDASFTLVGVSEPEVVLGAKIDGQFLEVLGVGPALGRTFSTVENQNKSRVALVSQLLWTRAFSSDSNWIGRSVQLSDHRYEIVGVLPAGFRFPGPYQPDVLVPGGYNSPPDWSSGAIEQLNVIARLAPSASEEAVVADLDALQQRHAADLPAGVAPLMAGRTTQVVPLATKLTGNARSPLLIFMAAVSLVVLIACVNVAALHVVRTVSNYGQLMIRAALGASKASLLRLVLMETAVLSCLGAVVGLAGAALLIKVLPTIGGQLVAPGTQVRMDATVAGFALALALLGVLVSGLANMLAIARLDVYRIANTPGRSVVRTWAGVLRSGLLVAQVAIAFVLVFGATLLIRSFANVMVTDTGVRTENVITFAVRLPASRYKPAQISEFARELISGLRPLPSVQGVAIANSLPFGSYNLGALFRTKPPVPGDSPQVVPVMAVSPEFFDTLGIPVLAGQRLPDTDGQAGKIALINTAFLRRFFGAENPIGRNLYWGPKEVLTIVGVVGDIRHVRPEEPPQPEVFVPLAQNPPQTMNVAVRASARSESLLAAVRNQVHQLDPEVPVLRVSSLEQRLAGLRGLRRLQLTVLGSFAAFGLVLAAAGLYASIAYAVTQNRREIGIRMALGAQRANVRRLFMRRAFEPIAAGVAAGGIASVWLASYIRALLFGVNATDPLSAAVTVVVLGGIGMLAGYFPAASAARTDPNTTLRYE